MTEETLLPARSVPAAGAVLNPFLIVDDDVLFATLDGTLRSPA